MWHSFSLPAPRLAPIMRPPRRLSRAPDAPSALPPDAPSCALSYRGQEPPSCFYQPLHGPAMPGSRLDSPGLIQTPSRTRLDSPRTLLSPMCRYTGIPAYLRYCSPHASLIFHRVPHASPLFHVPDSLMRTCNRGPSVHVYIVALALNLALISTSCRIGPGKSAPCIRVAMLIHTCRIGPDSPLSKGV